MRHGESFPRVPSGFPLNTGCIEPRSDAAAWRVGILCMPRDASATFTSDCFKLPGSASRDATLENHRDSGQQRACCGKSECANDTKSHAIDQREARDPRADSSWSRARIPTHGDECAARERRAREGDGGSDPRQLRERIIRGVSVLHDHGERDQESEQDQKRAGCRDERAQGAAGVAAHFREGAARCIIARAAALGARACGGMHELAAARARHLLARGAPRARAGARSRRDARAPRCLHRSWRASE